MDRTADLQRSWTALGVLHAVDHIDDAVDGLVDRFGWDETFVLLAALEDEPRALEGLYSLLCGLFLDEVNGIA